MTVENDQDKGCVKITYTLQDASNTTPAKIKVKRKVYGEALYTTIGEVAIAGSDFPIVIGDFFTATGTRYQYSLVPVVNGIEKVGATGEITADFKGILLMDDTSRYVSLTGFGQPPKCEYTPNYSMNYVPTFYNRTPYAIRNGNMSYCTGTVNGIFSPYELSNNADDPPASWRQGFISFLLNGKEKLLKDYSGNMWMVQIDNQPKEVHGDFGYIGEMQFNWTEVSDISPSAGVVKLT